MNGTVVHLYLTGAQSVTVGLVDDGTLVSAEVLGEVAGRCVARVIGPPGEMWALVAALSEGLTVVCAGRSAEPEDPVTAVVEPLAGELPVRPVAPVGNGQ